MKKYVAKSLIVLLIFTFTAFFSHLLFALSRGTFSTTIGLNKEVGMLATFAVLCILSWVGLLGFKKRIGTSGVLATMAMVLFSLIVLNLSEATIKFTYKISPFYVSWILGMIAGYLVFSKNQRRFLLVTILSVFPIIMTFRGYGLWVHRIEYGNWTGEVEEQEITPFELRDKTGKIVNNNTLKDKVVLLDFWFIACGPCWVKFPDLQRLYEQYQNNPLVKIYAVNRPMKRDKPGASFKAIKDKGYSFPVLQGTQEVMDKLGVYKYPTVMILDKGGKLIFMGELDDAEKKLKAVLNP